LADFNKSFGTFYRGELLSVGYKATSIGDGTSKILTHWKSPSLVDETGGASEQTSRLLGETARNSGKGPCTFSKKTSVSLGKPSASSRKKITDKKGSLLFQILQFSLFKIPQFPTHGFAL
jgi:hypothetical protein